MSQHTKSNILFTIFLVFLIIGAFLITFFLINNHNKMAEKVPEPKQPYYSFKEVSKKDTIDVFTEYPINPITINIDNKVSISGLKNKEVETKINNKLAKLDTSKNEYGGNFCYVNFNYSNVLNIDCIGNSITLNLVDGEDIKLEEIFQKDSDLLEIVKDALYRKYCPLIGCEELSYNENNIIDNYLIAALKEIKNNNYEISLNEGYVSLYLNKYVNYTDNFDIILSFSNYINDITIFNRFLTDENIYEEEITEYCNPQNCTYSLDANETYYQNYQSSNFLTSKNYLATRIYNFTDNDITRDYKYEYENLDLDKIASKINNILIDKYDLTKENNYQNINISVDIYNTSYDYKLVSYSIDIKEFNKNEFIKYTLGHYKTTTLSSKYIFKNNMIITKDGNIAFLEDNPSNIFKDFDNTLYDYIMANENDFKDYLICDFYQDYETCLKEYSYQNLIKDASYAIDKENRVLHMFYQSPNYVVTTVINRYIPFSFFTLNEIE